MMTAKESWSLWGQRHVFTSGNWPLLLKIKCLTWTKDTEKYDSVFQQTLFMKAWKSWKPNMIYILGAGMQL